MHSNDQTKVDQDPIYKNDNIQIDQPKTNAGLGFIKAAMQHLVVDKAHQYYSKDDENVDDVKQAEARKKLTENITSLFKANVRDAKSRSKDGINQRVTSQLLSTIKKIHEQKKLEHSKDFV